MKRDITYCEHKGCKVWVMPRVRFCSHHRDLRRQHRKKDKRR